MRLHLVIALFVYFITALPLSSEVRYYNSFSGFGNLNKSNNHTVSDDCLCIYNPNVPNLYKLVDIELENCDFTFEIKISNINNEEGKKYAYTDKDGSKSKKMNTSWGVVWNYIDSLNYCILELSGHNESLNNISDKRALYVAIKAINDGKSSLLYSTHLYKNVNLNTGFNIIRLNKKRNEITFSIGNKKLHHFETISLNEIKGKIGYFTGAGAKTMLERIYIDYKPYPEINITSSWTEKDILTHVSNSKDPYEGYWTYLDRNIDETKVKLGGRYTVALIRTKHGYDIIYLDGAKVNGSSWQAGMVKGKLLSTKFEDHYNLIWYDALMNPFNVDVYGKILDNNILELNFPVQNSILRFSKK